MPKFLINQLVRDNRVSVFESQGCKVAYTQLPPAAAEEQLRSKLMEESTEVALAADEQELLKEVADLYQVMESLLALNGFGMDDLAEKVQERKDALGGFESRTFIETIDAPLGSETYEYHKANNDKYQEVDA